jgi:hypothetical protein
VKKKFRRDLPHTQTNPLHENVHRFESQFDVEFVTRGAVCSVATMVSFVSVLSPSLDANRIPSPQLYYLLSLASFDVGIDNECNNPGYRPKRISSKADIGYYCRTHVDEPKQSLIYLLFGVGLVTRVAIHLTGL